MDLQVEGALARLAWAGMGLAGLAHVLALAQDSTAFAFVLCAMSVCVAVGVQPVALMRATTNGHSLGSLLSAISANLKAVLALSLLYCLYHFVGKVQVLAADGELSSRNWMILASSAAFYMCALGGAVVDLPPVERTAPTPSTGDELPIPSFRMADRSGAIVVGSLVVFFPLANWLLGAGFGIAAAAMVAFVALVNGVSFLLLRCPRCGKLATKAPSGWSSMIVGSKCRWCGQPY